MTNSEMLALAERLENWPHDRSMNWPIDLIEEAAKAIRSLAAPEKEDVLGGDAVFTGSRLSVLHIGKMVEGGERVENIIEDYPYLTDDDVKFASLYYRAFASPPSPRYAEGYAAGIEAEAKFQIGDRVTKVKGSSWTGRIVGTYRTALTPEGYAVESETETGSVQIYPASALRALTPGGSDV